MLVGVTHLIHIYLTTSKCESHQCEQASSVLCFQEVSVLWERGVSRPLYDLGILPLTSCVLLDRALPLSEPPAF